MTGCTTAHTDAIEMFFHEHMEMTGSNYKTSRRLTPSEFIRGLLWAMALLLLLLSRDFFPNSSFVQKYLNGPYGLFGFVWVIVLVGVAVFSEKKIYEMRRKQHDRVKRSNQA